MRLNETYSGQNNQDLTLNKHCKNAANSKKKTFPCPFNADPLSCYQTTLQMICWSPPASMCGEGGSVRRLFRRPASKEQLAEWKAKGYGWQFSPCSNRNYGKNYINTSLKAMAKMCGYTNYKHCTAHGKRRAGLSTAANFGVSPAVLMQMGGHSILSMVATYHKPNQTAYDFAIRSKHGDADSIRKQMELFKAGGNSTTGAIISPPVSVVTTGALILTAMRLVFLILQTTISVVVAILLFRTISLTSLFQVDPRARRSRNQELPRSILQ